MNIQNTFENQQAARSCIKNQGITNPLFTQCNDDTTPCPMMKCPCDTSNPPNTYDSDGGPCITRYGNSMSFCGSRLGVAVKQDTEPGPSENIPTIVGGGGRGNTPDKVLADIDFSSLLTDAQRDNKKLYAVVIYSFGKDYGYRHLKRSLYSDKFTKFKEAYTGATFPPPIWPNGGTRYNPQKNSNALDDYEGNLLKGSSEASNPIFNFYRPQRDLEYYGRYYKSENPVHIQPERHYCYPDGMTTQTYNANLRLRKVYLPQTACEDEEVDFVAKEWGTNSGVSCLGKRDEIVDELISQGEAAFCLNSKCYKASTLEKLDTGPDGMRLIDGDKFTYKPYSGEPKPDGESIMKFYVAQQSPPTNVSVCEVNQWSLEWDGDPPVIIATAGNTLTGSEDLEVPVIPLPGQTHGIPGSVHFSYDGGSQSSPITKAWIDNEENGASFVAGTQVKIIGPQPIHGSRDASIFGRLVPVEPNLERVRGDAILTLAHDCVGREKTIFPEFDQDHDFLANPQVSPSYPGSMKYPFRNTSGTDDNNIRYNENGVTGVPEKIGTAWKNYRCGADNNIAKVILPPPQRVTGYRFAEGQTVFQGGKMVGEVRNAQRLADGNIELELIKCNNLIKIPPTREIRVPCEGTRIIEPNVCGDAFNTNLGADVQAYASAHFDETCDCTEDPISMEIIERGDGFCSYGSCFDWNTVTDLSNRQVSTNPATGMPIHPLIREDIQLIGNHPFNKVAQNNYSGNKYYLKTATTLSNIIPLSVVYEGGADVCVNGRCESLDAIHKVNQNHVADRNLPLNIKSLKYNNLYWDPQEDAHAPYSGFDTDSKKSVFPTLDGTGATIIENFSNIPGTSHQTAYFPRDPTAFGGAGDCMEPDPNYEWRYNAPYAESHILRPEYGPPMVIQHNPFTQTLNGNVTPTTTPPYFNNQFILRGTQGPASPVYCGVRGKFPDKESDVDRTVHDPSISGGERKLEWKYVVHQWTLVEIKGPPDTDGMVPCEVLDVEKTVESSCINSKDMGRQNLNTWKKGVVTAPPNSYTGPQNAGSTTIIGLSTNTRIPLMQKIHNAQKIWRESTGAGITSTIEGAEPDILNLQDPDYYEKVVLGNGGGMRLGETFQAYDINNLESQCSQRDKNGMSTWGGNYVDSVRGVTQWIPDGESHSSETDSSGNKQAHFTNIYWKFLKGHSTKLYSYSDDPADTSISAAEHRDNLFNVMWILCNERASRRRTQNTDLYDENSTICGNTAPNANFCDYIHTNPSEMLEVIKDACPNIDMEEAKCDIYNYNNMITRCSNAKRAGAGNCFVCVNQHPNEIQCPASEIDKFCTGLDSNDVPVKVKDDHNVTPYCKQVMEEWWTGGQNCKCSFNEWWVSQGRNGNELSPDGDLTNPEELVGNVPIKDIKQNYTIYDKISDAAGLVASPCDSDLSGNPCLDNQNNVIGCIGPFLSPEQVKNRIDTRCIGNPPVCAGAPQPGPCYWEETENYLNGEINRGQCLRRPTTPTTVIVSIPSIGRNQQVQLYLPRSRQILDTKEFLKSHYEYIKEYSSMEELIEGLPETINLAGIQYTKEEILSGKDSDSIIYSRDCSSQPNPDNLECKNIDPQLLTRFDQNQDPNKLDITCDFNTCVGVNSLTISTVNQNDQGIIQNRKACFSDNYTYGNFNNPPKKLGGKTKTRLVTNDDFSKILMRTKHKPRVGNFAFFYGNLDDPAFNPGAPIPPEIQEFFLGVNNNTHPYNPDQNVNPPLAFNHEMIQEMRLSLLYIQSQTGSRATNFWSFFSGFEIVQITEPPRHVTYDDFRASWSQNSGTGGDISNSIYARRTNPDYPTLFESAATVPGSPTLPINTNSGSARDPLVSLPHGTPDADGDNYIGNQYVDTDVPQWLAVKANTDTQTSSRNATTREAHRTTNHETNYDPNGVALFPRVADHGYKAYIWPGRTVPMVRVTVVASRDAVISYKSYCEWVQIVDPGARPDSDSPPWVAPASQSTFMEPAPCTSFGRDTINETVTKMQYGLQNGRGIELLVPLPFLRGFSLPSPISPPWSTTASIANFIARSDESRPASYWSGPGCGNGGVDIGSDQYPLGGDEWIIRTWNNDVEQKRTHHDSQGCYASTRIQGRCTSPYTDTVLFPTSNVHFYAGGNDNFVDIVNNTLGGNKSFIKTCNSQIFDDQLIVFEDCGNSVEIRSLFNPFSDPPSTETACNSHAQYDRDKKEYTKCKWTTHVRNECKPSNEDPIDSEASSMVFKNTNQPCGYRKLMKNKQCSDPEIAHPSLCNVSTIINTDANNEMVSAWHCKYDSVNKQCAKDQSTETTDASQRTNIGVDLNHRRSCTDIILPRPCENYYEIATGAKCKTGNGNTCVADMTDDERVCVLDTGVSSNNRQEVATRWNILDEGCNSIGQSNGWFGGGSLADFTVPGGGKDVEDVCMASVGRIRDGWYKCTYDQTHDDILSMDLGECVPSYKVGNPGSNGVRLVPNAQYYGQHGEYKGDNAITNTADNECSSIGDEDLCNSSISGLTGNKCEWSSQFPDVWNSECEDSGDINDNWFSASWERPSYALYEIPTIDSTKTKIMNMLPEGCEFPIASPKNPGEEEGRGGLTDYTARDRDINKCTNSMGWNKKTGKFEYCSVDLNRNDECEFADPNNNIVPTLCNSDPTQTSCNIPCGELRPGTEGCNSFVNKTICPGSDTCPENCCELSSTVNNLIRAGKTVSLNTLQDNDIIADNKDPTSHGKLANCRDSGFWHPTISCDERYQRGDKIDGFQTWKKCEDKHGIAQTGCDATSDLYVLEEDVAKWNDGECFGKYTSNC